MLELKYNCSIDVDDFSKRVQEQCDRETALSVRRLVDCINAQDDLFFLDKQRRSLLHLRLGWREMQSFEDGQGVQGSPKPRISEK